MLPVFSQQQQQHLQQLQYSSNYTAYGNIYGKSDDTYGNKNIFTGKSPHIILEKGHSYADSNIFRKALITTILTVSSAALFGVGIYIFIGKQASEEFLVAYIVEQSLSIDNLFVFVMLFSYFKVPIQNQNRVLSYGILGAVIMRAIFIFIGIELIGRFKIFTIFFALILIISAYKLLTDDEEENDLENNFILKISRKFITSTTEYDGERFFSVEKGKKIATPLLMCLICIELSDLVFAVDSIPAVLGISHSTLIVFSSNIFAIMSLRSLFTIVNTAVTNFIYLKTAVALVLAFVGSKMIAEYFQYTVSTESSLAVVVLILSVGILLSITVKYSNYFRTMLTKNNRHKNNTRMQ